MVDFQCSYCGKAFPQLELKRCARCHSDLYCSRDCQRASWKYGHKQRCKVVPMDPSSPEWDEHLLDKQLNRWIDTWERILWTLGVLALDLPHRPDNIQATHMAVICISPRPHMSNPAQCYKINWGGVWSHERCKSTWPEVPLAPIEELEPNRARLVITMVDEEGDLRRTYVLSCQLGRIEEYRKLPKEFSRKIASRWVSVLAALLDRGDVEEANRKWYKPFS
ncbi:hypothetical protein BDN72DRAFT_613392 [Pluteus cervinus]|uniref:Uncharacterized protein n=1 Tax=Pluteus cervinus TaxID=181527 RepID=A0ACD3AV11_9AGAR|nr:hypothetical protein BDN72DRAFT_613392 [Pluteus cervinus]